MLNEFFVATHFTVIYILYIPIHGVNYTIGIVYVKYVLYALFLYATKYVDYGVSVPDTPLCTI